MNLHSTMVLFKSPSFDIDIISRKYLHSTMVLFKLAPGTNRQALAKFTFHYGPIQIALVIPLLSFL